MVEDLEDRILALEDLDRLLRSRGEVLKREEEVYYAQIQPDVELYRALFEQHPCLTDSARKILSDILARSRVLTPEDTNDNPPCADLGLWPTENAFLADEADWYRFQRESLRLCGVTEVSFCEQVSRIFPNLVLSSAFPACLGTLEGGFDHVLPAVIRALTALNDKLLPSLGEHDIVEGLKRFSVVSGFETSMEGKAERNPVLTFDFPRDGKAKRIVCAPHMKLSSSDAPGDGQHYFNRIYFNPHQEDGSELLIHVGHVGAHL